MYNSKLNLFLKLFFLYFMLMNLTYAYATSHLHPVQKKPIQITKSLIEKIANLEPKTSNADYVTKMIGPPSACLPLNMSPEMWVCQWKTNISSSAVFNTLNVLFEGGSVTSVIAIDDKGNYTEGKRPSPTRASPVASLGEIE